MTATALDLLARHAEYLAARAISGEVAAARGYRSIGRAEARELGFTDSQAQPGLLIPLYRVDGEPGAYQLRPDQPRTTKDSKEIKYETPRKQKNVLDVNPLVREALGKGRQAIFITEGAAKVDALASIGIPGINLAGVYGWRGKSSDDGYTALPDWEMVSVKGSIFVLAFDSDILTKLPVHQALSRLKRLLEARGAERVRVLVVPELLTGKTGVDDYIAETAATPEDLAKLVIDGLPPPPISANGHRPATDIGEEPDLYTDMRLARRIVTRYGDEIRHCKQWNSWLIWDGRRWKPDDRNFILHLAQETVLGLYVEAREAFAKSTEAAGKGDKATQAKEHERAGALFRWAEKSEATARLEAAIAQAKADQNIVVVPGQLDSDQWVLNCLNGMVDLRTGALLPHDKDKLLTKLAPVNYEPEATLDLWDRFLSEALPDENTQSYVQRCVGATIAGVAVDDLLLVCHGLGGTGKGTFLNAIHGTLGDYAAAADLQTFTTRRDAGGPQPDLARLQGKRMVAISEVESGGAVALLKRATGGDLIVTRSHHQESFEFIPQFTIWIITNDRPNVPHHDTGIWRRLREIPFETRFTTPDTSIRPRLSNPEVAGSAILAWAVLGCLAWQTVGVGNLPEKVRQATESYRAEMDPLSDWLEDSCVVIDNIWTPAKSLWSNYMEWSKENHLRYPLGRKTFSQRLNERFSELRRGKNRERGFVGLGVKRALADTSEVSATPDDQVYSLISFFIEEKLEGKCPQVSAQIQNSYEDEVSAQAQNEVSAPVRQVSAESPTCELCGKDDFRYSAAGELVCASCFPDA